MPIEAHNARDLRHLVWTGRRTHARWIARLGRLMCFCLLLILTACIGLYVRLTNPDRVRSLAQEFFARYIDADLEIGKARLSLFDGLQLDDVAIVEHGGGEHSTVVRAKRLQVSYSPLALLAGRLESARVLAIEPQLFVVEDAQTGRWNLERLHHPAATSRPSAEPESGRALPPLPEVLVRGGSVVRAQVDRGRYRTLQTVRLEGQFLPGVDSPGAYGFNLQSRTAQGAAGPAFQGWFSPGDGAAESSLTNVELAFLEPLLPARVRDFWRMLAPAGRVDVPVLRMNHGGGTGFHIELQLADISMDVRPTDWASAAERAVLQGPERINASLAALPVDTSLLSAAVELQPKLRTGVIPLRGVRGRFIFTDAGVVLDRLAATIDGNPFDIHGRLDGYTIDAPIELHIASPADRPIELRASIPYIDALPAEIREVYYRFAPRGRSNLHVSVARARPGEPLAVTGAIEFANADFTFQEFRYPIRNASGRLVVDADPATGEPRLVIDKVRGNGPADGPNADSELAVDGVIAPLIGYASVDVSVSGKDVHSEPALIAALPAEARSVIAEFDDDGPGPNPVFSGDFDCHVKREPGAISRWSYDTDVSVRNARGAFRAFPYPLRDLSVELLIRKDYVRILNARSSWAGGTIEVSGLSEWGRRIDDGRPRKIGDSNLRTSLTLKGRDVPIDDALLGALPAEARETLVRFGIGGTIDITGPITVSDPRADPQFDLTIEARDGRFAPADWATHVEAIAATLQLTPGRLRIDRAVGRRGDARVTLSGDVDFASPDRPMLSLDANADGLLFDPALRDSLPEPARRTWNSLRPAGVADVSLRLSGDATEPTWQLEVRPRGDAMLDRPEFFPMPITAIAGTIRASAARLDIAGTSADIAGGRATLDGVGEWDGRSSWSLKLKTLDTSIGRETLDALPAALGAMLKESEVAGRADLDFRRLDWTSLPDGRSTDIVFDAAATVRDGSWRTGIAFDKAAGTFVLRGHVVDDDPVELAGDLTLRTFRMAGLDARDGSAAIETNPASRAILVRGMRATVGAGNIAGDVTLDRSRPRQTRWSADFLLRNADVAALTAAAPTRLSGTLNASLAMEGGWTDGGAPLPRRGRGDISVSGKDMVDVPMVLGVTQIVSLKLPFTGGFNEATASYSLDGDRVSFSDIDLQSSEMRIKGAGWLDFDRKQVSLDFYTDSTDKKLPVIGHLLDAARRELFQIKVRGALQEPQVKAGSLRTITTTVDEILNNEADGASR